MGKTLLWLALVLLVAIMLDSTRGLRKARARGLSWKYILYTRYCPVWKWRARACKARAGWKCERCGALARGVGWLEAHHLTYVRLGHEWPEDLMALCHTCHEKTTRAERAERQYRARNAERDRFWGM